MSVGVDAAAALSTALAALALGVILLGLSLLALRWFAARGPRVAVEAPVALPETGAAGMLVAQPGGRLLFADDAARRLFGLDGQEPNLWRLVQQARPADNFLGLFAAPGSARLTVGDRQVEATSVRLPAAGASPDRIVVMLRELGRLPELAAADDHAAQATTLVAEFGRAIAASLDLDTTLDASLAAVGRAFTFDLAEITLWDETAGFLASARTSGDRHYDRELAQTGAAGYRRDEGLSGWIARERQPLRVPDLASFTEARPRLDRADFPFRAYLGVPLMAGDDFVGTLELARYRPDPYPPGDLPLLEAIAGQTAVAVRNAQRYGEQQKRVAELSGLAEITRAIESTADPRTLRERLTRDIARLMDVQIAGILLHAPAASALVAQPPFFGLPDIIVDMYRLPLPPAGLPEAARRDQAHWLSNDLARDGVVDTFGLRELANMVGVKTTLIVPIAVGGRNLGALQVANKRGGAPFGEQDARLLAIFADQAAAILDNARLVGEAQTRARQEEALRQIAATTAGTDLDEILRAVMPQAAGLLRFDVGLVALLDETRGELTPHPASCFGLTTEQAETIHLRADDPSFTLSVTRLRRPVLAAQASADPRLAGAYYAMIEALALGSVLDVPLVIGERCIGELVMGARAEGAFVEPDLQLAGTVAAELASAIERARLYAATDQDLQRRVGQLTALTRVGRELNQTLDQERLLRLVHDEALPAARADCGTIVLLDPAAPGTAALRIGEEPLGSALTALEQEAAQTERVVRYAGLPADAPQAAHPEVRAALVVPIVVQSAVVGLIHLHSRDPEGFDAPDVETAGALAAQAAVAVANAQRYADQLKRGELLRRRADQLAQLFQVSRTVRSDRPLAENLEAIAFGLQEAVGFDVVLVSVLDPQTRRLQRTASAGIPLATFEALRQVEQSWDNFAGVLRDEFRLSESYFLPHETTADLTNGIDTVTLMKGPSAAWTPERWHPDDMLLVPLRSSGQAPLGLLTVDNPRDGLRPDRATVEIIEIFANQAAVAIENARLYRSAERRAARLLALHHVIEHASRAVDREQVWQTVAEGLAEEMGLDACLIALARDEGSRYDVPGRAGDLPPEVDFGPLFAAAEAATAEAGRAQPTLVFSTRESQWGQHPVVMAARVSSFLRAPILSQGQPAGILFVGSRQTPSPFAPEDVELFTILTNQLAASLESARLEADVRERAQQLAALAEVSQTVTAALRTEDVVQALMAANGLHSVVAYDSLTIWLREGEQLRVAAARGFEDDAERLGLRVDIADSVLFGEMAQTRDAIVVPDVRADARFPAGALQPTRSWLGAPLVSKGQIIGALALDKTEPRAYSRATAQVLMAFANQAAVALDNARLFEESEQRAWELDDRSRRLALLNRVSAQLGRTLELRPILETALTEMQQALDVQTASAVLLDAAGQVIVSRSVPERAPAPGEAVVPLDPRHPALLRVRESLAPLSVEDALHSPLLEPARPDLAARGVRSLLIVPLAVADELVGAVQLEVRETRHFSPSEIELAQTIANQAAVAVQNARLYDETQTRLAELATLNQISRAISFTIDIQEVYQTVAEQVAQVLNTTTLYLALYDEARRELSFPLVIERGRRLEVPPMAPSGLSRYIVRTRAPLLLRGDDISQRLQELGAVSIGSGAARAYLGVPLLTGDRVIGVLAVQDLERPNTFTYEHVRVLSTIASQVAVAVENARLVAELQSRAVDLTQRNARLAFLSRLSDTLSTSLDLDTILRRATEEVVRLFQVDHSGTILFDEGGRSGTVAAEYPEHGVVGTPVALEDDPLEQELLARRAPVQVTDTATDARLSPALRQTFQRLGIQSILIAPFMSQGRAFGSISLDAMDAPRAFTPDEVELLQTIAGQVAVALTNARSAAELEARVATRTYELSRERERVETLLQITTELSSSLDLDLVLSRALQLVTDAVNAPQGSIFLLDLETDRLIYRAALGRSRPLPTGGEPAPLKRNEGLAGWVIKNRQAVVIGDLSADPRWKPLPGPSIQHKSALAVPLMANEDALGAMILLSPYADAFDEDQLRLVEAAANQVGAAINNAELYRLIRDQAERLGGMLRTQQVEATKSRAILEGIADGVLVADGEGQIILFNAACERVLELERENVMGRPITEFVGIYGAAGRSWIENITRWSLDPGRLRPGEFLSERLELADKRVLLVHLAPVTTGDEYLGSVSVIRDITREVEVDRLKSEFVTNVSHELRTPMTSIKGYADLLLLGAAGPVNAQQSRFVEVIKGNADRLSMLVNDLLDISRIESGRVALTLRPLNVAEVFAQVADTMRGRVDEEKKPMTLLAEVPPDLPPVRGDRERLTQVIMNLADNAFNYSPAGGTITLRARYDAEARQVRLEITDTGVGIALEDQPRLFDRFYRGEDALVLARAGTGLGLPIARQLVEMHGGHLWLERSAPGAGSTFALTLPSADEAPDG